ncbi:MAG: transcriptional regulator GcvA [Proteobacteria bacterium]|nr:transcriptional regulator GcvA [Pseudomonadota bacterium]
MTEELPPIASLRAFARAAKTLSFKSAAEELHVSPSALSRQIQAVEQHLGVTLFRRLNPGLELTDAGHRYLETVEQVLRDLRAAQQALGAPRTGALRVSSLASFTAKWLVPHRAEFEAACPGVELEIEATLEYADFERDPVDVAIRFGTGPWEGLHSEPLLDLDFFPVCSPAAPKGDPPLTRIPELAAHTWIHLSQLPHAWREWVAATGHPALRSAREVVYDHVDIALSAAAAGQGVALSSRILCGAELADGRLCRPFEDVVRARETYHLVCRPEGLDDPRIAAFRDWLVEALSA